MNQDFWRSARCQVTRVALAAMLLLLVLVPLPLSAQDEPEQGDVQIFMPLVTGEQEADQLVQAAASSDVVISEFRVRGPNGGNDEFIELYNISTMAVDIGGWRINGSNNAGTTSTRVTIAPGTILNPGCYYLLTNSTAAYSGGVPGDQTFGTGITDDGGIAIVLPDNSIIDQVGMSSGSAYKEGTILASLGGGSASNLNRGYERKPGGAAGHATDTDNNSSDFQLIAPSNPQNSASPCIGGDAAPVVVSTTPADGATGAIAYGSIFVNFNEAVNVTGNWFTLNCTVSGSQNVTISGGPTSYTVTPGSTLTAEESCTGTIVAANVTDDDPDDPPDAMAEDYSFNFTVETPPTLTLISAIQGSGPEVVEGTFTVEAIVVGDYQTQGPGQLRGFFLQEEDANADGDPATSEGIFVFCSGCPVEVAVGDWVRVTGESSDFFGMSQLTATTIDSVRVVRLGNALPTPATVDLPVPGVPTDDLAAATAAINAYFERIEGMLVSFPDTLTISEYFELARYGQIILSEGGRPRQFTDAHAPSVAGRIAHEAEVASRTIILDDTNNRQNYPIDANPDVPYFYPVPGLSVDNFFRGGDSITGLTGVLHWSFAGQGGTDAWRIRPVIEAFDYTFTPVNERPATAPDVGGSLTVASFNVLNYFLTVDTTSSNNVGNCGASTSLDCRGADSDAEREQQQMKLTAALQGIDADIFGLIELENTPEVDPLAEIAADLNAATAPGTYVTIDTGVIGTDAIKVGLIYKPSQVTPVGAPRVDLDPVHNRPPVAQLFTTADGARFIVVVNHFKSKGCGDATGADLDQGDGQGCYNAQRVAQAEALLRFINTIVSESGEPDVLIIGDLNAYAQEDPIVALEDAGYANLVEQFGGADAYSYVFDGQLGYLDHALASPSLTSQVTGAGEWHINADEIPLFDYNDTVADAGESSFEKESDALPLDEPGPWRTSDHDPVLVGLELNKPPVCTAAKASQTSLWPVNHNFATINVLDVEDPEGDAVALTIDSIFQDEAVDAPDSGNTSPDGQGIGTSTAQVRAERVGTGNGRVYHIAFTAEDGFGGACSGAVQVGVPVSRNGVAVDDGANYDSTVAAASAATLLQNGAGIFLPLVRP